MAGKADLVNSIADSASYLQAIPEQDGWKHDAVAGHADAPAPGGSLTLDLLGGATG